MTFNVVMTADARYLCSSWASCNFMFSNFDTDRECDGRTDRDVSR